jgi:hypothetical protein
MTRWDADGAFGLFGGCAAIVGAAFAAAVMFSPGETVARLVVMSLAMAGVTALTRDWRASAGAAVLAVLVFVGFLVDRAGVLTGDPGAWVFAAVIPVAALAGWSRRLRWPRIVVAHRSAAPAPARATQSRAMSA